MDGAETGSLESRLITGWKDLCNPDGHPIVFTAPKYLSAFQLADNPDKLSGGTADKSP